MDVTQDCVEHRSPFLVWRERCWASNAHRTRRASAGWVPASTEVPRGIPPALREAAREGGVELGADQGDRGFAGEGGGQGAGPRAFAAGAAGEGRRAAEGGGRADGAEADLGVGGEARL